METLQDFAGLFTRWRIWWLLAVQDIALRYRRSAIGPFWITLSIAVFTLSVSYVYAQIFAQPFSEHLIRVATGYFMWHFISAMILDGAHSVIDSAASLKNVRIPLTVVAARTVARNLIIMAHNMAAIVPLIVIFSGKPFTLALVALVPAACLLIPLALFVAIALGPLGARYRDLSEMLRSMMSVCFFITPVIWPADRLDPESPILRFNPFYHLIELVRAPLLGTPPSAENWIVAGLCLATAFGCALVSFSASRRRLALWV